MIAKYFLLVVLSLAIPAIAGNAKAVVGLTDKGEQITDCLLLTSKIDSDLVNQIAVVQAKSSGLKVVGTVEFRGNSAIFKPTKVVTTDGVSHAYKMLPLIFDGIVVRGALIVEVGDQCGRPVNESK